MSESNDNPDVPDSYEYEFSYSPGPVPSISDSDDDDSDDVITKIGILARIKSSSLTHLELCTCWIERSSSICALITARILEKDDATKLLRLMKFIYRNVQGGYERCYYRWWLIAAITYNHIELLNLILADFTFGYLRSNHNSDAVHCHLINPLFIAIERGDISLVKAFLLAGSAVTLNGMLQNREYFNSLFCSRVNDISNDEYLHEKLSAVEYACVVNQPEVMKVLVSHYELHHPKRTLNSFQSDSDFHMIRDKMGIRDKKGFQLESYFHPLHSIAMLATKFYGQNLVQLPAFVQLIINESDSVDWVDFCGRNPLQGLIRLVKFMTPLDDAVAAEHRRIIMEVTEILLKAGSCINMPERFDDYSTHPVFLMIRRLDVRKEIIMLLPNNITRYELACTIRNNLQLVTDLTKLLFVNGANVSQFKFYELYVIPLAAVRMLKGSNSSRYAEVCGEIMDILSNLLRYFLLVGGNRVTDAGWYQFGFEDEPCGEQSFVDSFIEIADFSSQPGRSEKLIYMILHTLSASYINRMRNLLGDERRKALENPTLRHSISQVDRAIKYIERVSVPSTLEYLACRAINRAMSWRGLLDDATKDLGIPVHMSPDVLLNHQTCLVE